MKRLIVLLICCFQFLLLMACSTSSQSDRTANDTDKLLDKEPTITLEEVDKAITIDQEIVFINQRLAWSDTYINMGYYIDKHGDFYTFDVSDMDNKYADPLELLNYLLNNSGNIVDINIEEDQLKENYWYLLHIDANAQIDSESIGCDQGSDITYGIIYKENGDVQLLMLEEKGDFERTNTDPYATKIMEWLYIIKENTP